MMTIPGLALFYAGMVRKKNVLATMAQSLAATALCSVLWAGLGYTLVFAGDGAVDRDARPRVAARHDGMDAISPFAKTIPEALFMLYQMTFAVITVGAGRRLGRRPHAVFGLSCGLPRSGSSSSTCRSPIGSGAAAFSPAAGVLDFAGGTVVHLNAGVAGLVARYRAGQRGAATAAKISRPTICRWRSSAPDCCGSAGSDSTAARRLPPIRAP